MKRSKNGVEGMGMDGGSRKIRLARGGAGCAGAERARLTGRFVLSWSNPYLGLLCMGACSGTTLGKPRWTASFPQCGKARPNLVNGAGDAIESRRLSAPCFSTEGTEGTDVEGADRLHIRC